MNRRLIDLMDNRFGYLDLFLSRFSISCRNQKYIKLNRVLENDFINYNLFGFVFVR